MLCSCLQTVPLASLCLGLPSSGNEADHLETLHQSQVRASPPSSAGTWGSQPQWWCSHRESQQDGVALCRGSSANATLEGWAGEKESVREPRLKKFEGPPESKGAIQHSESTALRFACSWTNPYMNRNPWVLSSANRGLNSGLRKPASGVLAPWAVPTFTFSTHTGRWSSQLWFPCIRSHSEQWHTSFSISSSVSFCISIRFIDSFLKTFKLTTV